MEHFEHLRDLKNDNLRSISLKKILEKAFRYYSPFPRVIMIDQEQGKYFVGHPLGLHKF